MLIQLHCAWGEQLLEHEEIFVNPGTTEIIWIQTQTRQSSHLPAFPDILCYYIAP